MSSNDRMDFVTVVSVGSENDQKPPSPKPRTHNGLKKLIVDDSSEFVTVLTIGEINPTIETTDTTEEVLVYRLPGERLGFGLKFEGGTKATEFVKRLYIQSCAPNSPASRVHCSWGSLSEGDEVLEIDSVSVGNMTRIDCVRSLKDSNVVIRLLIKHCVPKSKEENSNEGLQSQSESLTRSTEDLPLVIRAEKKRVPPPPPPVPPRRIPKRHSNAAAKKEAVGDNHQTSKDVVNGNKNSRFQSPRSSGRIKSTRRSPEISRQSFKDRRLSDGSIVPPNAEVYLDLFSSEQTCNLSESDDTGSSISTVIDKFSSYPTTTNSSFAGSVPSTPTLTQKQLDLGDTSDSFDIDDIDHISNKNCFINKQFRTTHDEVDSANIDQKYIKQYWTISEENNSLIPPANFQDAPLSYGNEDIGIVEATIKNIAKQALNLFPQVCLQYEDENGNCVKTVSVHEFKTHLNSISNKNKLATSCEETSSNKAIVDDINDGTIKKSDLPRLVDFVPKSIKGSSGNEHTNLETISKVKSFLENEIRVSSHLKEIEEKCNEDYCNNYNRSSSSQLATIGEDDEDNLSEIFLNRHNNFMPIVVIENADDSKTNDESDMEKDVERISFDPHSPLLDAHLQTSLDAYHIMEAPPSSSRQPPDGDEFPDYHETAMSKPITDFHKPTTLSTSPAPLWKSNAVSYLYRDQQSAYSVRDKIAIFSNPNASGTLTKTYKSTDDISDTTAKANNLVRTKRISKSVISVDNIENSLDDSSKFVMDKKYFNKASDDNAESPLKIAHSHFSSDSSQTAQAINKIGMHTRSQSLINISNSAEVLKKDKWALLAEQRRRSLSKLKGLIIPEKVLECESPTVPDLPEIKSHHAPLIENASTNNFSTPITTNSASSYLTTPILNTPAWSSNVPKYSPAFKRKSLNVYTAVIPKNDNGETTGGKTNKSQLSQSHKIPTSLTLSDAPKSLESITSPTKSDCSFEYLNCSSPDIKTNRKDLTKSSLVNNRFCHTSSFKGKEDIGRSEDESDNDSAVSSSQSSYISRNSPPISPNHLRVNNPNEDGTDPMSYRNQAESKYDYHRLLKPQSVEALNRKNILASAKCRSGRDLKIGSPLIQRKFNENESENCDEQQSHDQTDGENEQSNLDIDDTENVELKETAPMSSKSHSLGRDAKMDHLKRQSIDLWGLSRNVKAANVTDLRRSFENLSPVVKKREIANVKVPKSAKVSARRNIELEQQEDKIDTEEEQVQDLDLKKDLADHEEEIILKPTLPGGSVGITLAGGSDYETKDVTIHKIRVNSAAHRDGRLIKGDNILSINGRSLKELTHKQIVAILKEPLQQVSIVRAKTTPLKNVSSKNSSLLEATTEKKVTSSLLSKSVVLELSLMKDAAGLGFSLEGGRDLLGDGENMPLLIKKVFKGGAAEKAGNLFVGDELLAINKLDVTCLSRVEAWSMIKKFSEGTVINLTIRR